jgi:hypothetical protein
MTPSPDTTSLSNTSLLGLGIIAATAAIIVVCFTVITVSMLRNKTVDVTAALQEIFRSERALQLVSVAAIVFALLVLALTNKISEGAIALLASIGGYVLGNLSKPQKSSPNTTQPRENRAADDQENI